MLENTAAGQRIAGFRKEKGLTQEQLARLLNVTGQAISKWEKGQALPDTALLPAIGRALDVSIDRLLTGGDFVIPDSPYDSQYAKDEYYWGLKHSALAEQVVGLMTEVAGEKKQLLDIGSGEGRDSVYFARSGFIVDALELSLHGIEKCKQYSAALACKVNNICANLIGYELTSFYHVIYSMGALQFLPPALRQRHFDKYKQATYPGGLNAHLVFVEKPFIKTAPDWEKDEFFYRSGELAGYYHDWEILYSEEQVFECTSADIPHRHAVCCIIARKIEE